MPKTKVKVTFQEDDEPIINGEKTTPHSDGNNGRNVYITPHFVLKVDDRGYSHDDLALWKRVSPRDRKYFVPVLAQGETDDGYGWSIQPFVNLDWDNITDEAEGIVSRLCDKYGLSDIDVFDGDGPRNWAINAKTGEPIIFDYGLGQSES